ncbi:hypothetical protein CANTEDRAFT_125017 [Yamadazyma tenuis ATCC 10573]|uniref:FCP1 homology domain-containing protein n=1 Tax=Candida tenuis (strain ATCC 10573 / BCRC 21748 / CBS 615 / JCM 9827 / NBRC 10315 / NRRL Y-1498 / VKM Y-70) TaxID=590646 RepID=G3B907_CANTC|nr:uncharacterized protein CANTEDRAFT_125017 [Yamadazyma tenuis ATCC 10573]EGV62668.1 hypothetical protein CANTEDRAFT_125017 [Yamadazyma tenuis ATCC 10573]
MNSVKVLFSSIDNFIPNQDPPADPPADEASAELSQIYEDNEGENEAESQEDESLNPHYSLHVLFQLLLRLPHLVVIKPLAFFWRLLLHPFSLILKSVDFDYAYHVDVQEKMDLIKHENILSNSIKSPTASSKYILPPPQRLFPLVRNPGKARRRKTLILDLDETLIHSLSKGSPRSLSGHDSNIIEIKLNSVATLYHVHRRPYCDYFLKEISKWFDLHIFTASVREYADPIIDWLENEAASDEKIFKKRYYRNDCTYRNGVGYIKDLTKFFPVEDLKNVIILDNSPVSYALNEDNGVMIEGWINDQNDKDLLNLLPMLHSLSLCIDVRFILGLRQGEKVFESYR